MCVFIGILQTGNIMFKKTKLPFNTQELSIFVPLGHRLVFCFESTLTIYNTFVIDIIDPVWR